VAAWIEQNISILRNVGRVSSSASVKFRHTHTGEYVVVNTCMQGEGKGSVAASANEGRPDTPVPKRART
jgi:hypothetical protein